MENYQRVKKIYSSIEADRVVLLVEKDGQQYAMKILTMEEDPQKQQVIFNEAKLLEKFAHPNIIKLQETSQFENKLYIVMEYADQGDLKKRVADKLQQEEYFEENQIKLGDFGVSKQLESQDILTNTHVGTSYYLSPEQCKGAPYNHKVDIWMLGCLLYELCTLEKPFKSDSFFGLYKQIKERDPNAIPEHYSNTMSQLVEAMMQKEPDMRPDINQIIAIPEIQAQYKKIKEEYADIYKDYIFPNPENQSKFIKEKVESSTPQLQSNGDDLNNSQLSSDSSSQQQQSGQAISPPISSPEKKANIIKQQQNQQGQLSEVSSTVQQDEQQVNRQNSNEQQQQQQQTSESQILQNSQMVQMADNQQKVQNQQTNYQQQQAQFINTPQVHQSQIQLRQVQQEGNMNYNSMQMPYQQQFISQEETFGINKPKEDYILQYPQQQMQNMQSSQIMMQQPTYPNQSMMKNNIGNPYMQQQQQMNNFQMQQQHTPYSSPNQYYSFFIGNTTSVVHSENVSPINGNPPLMQQQISLQHHHINQTQFGFQSGYIPSGNNSNNSSMVMDLRSPNTQNSVVQQNVSELNSPMNMPFSPINQYDPNHYQSPYPPYSQNINQIQQNTPIQQQPMKKQPVKIPRYKPPIQIDTTIGGNYSQKKSTPNSDVLGRGGGLGSGKSGNSGNSAQNSQKNSSATMMVVMDGENQGQSSSICGSSYNNSSSSNTTSNQSSTKNNSTKNQQCPNSQYGQNLPTMRIKPKTFNFPQSPNRTYFVSEYLKQRVGEERFVKMKTILDSSSNPQKIIDNPQIVADIIGEENMELAFWFRHVTNSQGTPSGSNHSRHKSFQGFDNTFPNSDQINKTLGFPQQQLYFQSNQQQSMQQQQQQQQQQTQQQLLLEQQQQQQQHIFLHQQQYQQQQMYNQQQLYNQPVAYMNSTQLTPQQQQQQHNLYTSQQHKNQLYQQQQLQKQQQQQQLPIQSPFSPQNAAYQPPAPQQIPPHHQQSNSITQIMDYVSVPIVESDATGTFNQIPQQQQHNNYTSQQHKNQVYQQQQQSKQLQQQQLPIQSPFSPQNNVYQAPQQIPPHHQQTNSITQVMDNSSVLPAESDITNKNNEIQSPLFRKM